MSNNNITEYLEQDSADFKRLRPLLDQDSPRGTRKIIKGYVQSRKSWMIIKACVYTVLVHKRTCLIIVENKTSALLQLQKRLLDYIIAMKEDVDVVAVKTLMKRGELSKTMKSEKPKIVISLRNDCDLKHLDKKVNTDSVFDVYIDESDVTDSVSGAKCQIYLDEILKNAKCIYSISATILSSMVKDQIEQNNVFIMSKPNGYRDISSLNIVDLPESTYSSKKDSNPFENDVNLKNYLAEFACRSLQGEHPNISLVRVSSTLTPQFKVAKYLYKKHPGIVTITYNGGGSITMRGKLLPKSSIVLGRKSSKVEENVHTFSDITIGKILTWLHEHGGVDRFERIMILAGKMADRGITFGSDNYSECIDEKKLPWHLTEMYYLTASCTDQPSIIQAAGRLCGVFPDSLNLTLYSNVAEDIKKAYLLQEELIQRALEVNFENMTFGELIEKVKISSEKIPKRRRIVAKGLFIDLDVVYDDEDDYDQKYVNIQNEYNNPDSDTYKVIKLFQKHDFKALTKESINTVCDDFSGLYFLEKSSKKFNLHYKVLEILRLMD
jgi:hypothetical protein